MKTIDEVSKDYFLVEKQQQAKIFGGATMMGKGQTFVTINTDYLATDDGGRLTGAVVDCGPLIPMNPPFRFW